MVKIFFAEIIIFALFAITFSNQSKANVPHFSVLSQHTEIILHEDYSVTYKVKKSTLVLDKNGLDHGDILIPYSEIHRIMAFEGRLIDPTKGKIIKKISIKDLSDFTNFSSGIFFDDERKKYYGLTEPKNFPLLVEVEYELMQKGNFHFRSWFPWSHYKQKTEVASLNIQYPEKLGLRYRRHHFEELPDSVYKDGTIYLSWEMNNLDPIGNDDEVMHLSIFPQKFALEGFEGDMSDWAGFGAWISKLNEDKDEISDALKADIHAVVKGLEREDEKIAALYFYLQQNFRYVYVAFGIGGWMPQSANEVYQQKYGECKGLTNLMKTMLKEVGIESQYALVRAGDEEEDIDIDFVSNQFNHAFLRIPRPDGAIWLECTSRTSSPGYLGDFTKNRYALVINEGVGFLEKTPDYKAKAFNTQVTESIISLFEDGNATIIGDYTFLGTEGNNYSGLEKFLKGNEQKTYLNKYLGGSGLLVTEYKIEPSSYNFVPKAHVHFEGVLQKFSQNTSKRVLLPLHWKKIQKDNLLSGELSVKDKYEIYLPENLIPEGELPNYSHSEEAFDYVLQTFWDEGVLRIETSIETHFSHSDDPEKINLIWQNLNTFLNKSIAFKK
jgi:hypothetical protein